MKATVKKLATVLQKIKEKPAFPDVGICTNVCKVWEATYPDTWALCDWADTTLGRLMRRWVELQPDKENRSSLIPIPHYDSDAAQGKMWTNPDRLALLDFCIEACTTSTAGWLLHRLYEVDTTKNASLCEQVEFRNEQDCDYFYEVMRKWPNRAESYAFPVEGDKTAFKVASTAGELWANKRRWELWHFMIEYMERNL